MSNSRFSHGQDTKVLIIIYEAAVCPAPPPEDRVWGAP